MKMKNDDGYVLIYVLVVFVLLSALAASVSGAAMKNLQAQEASISRMEQRYAAEGEIEELVAKAQSQTTSLDFVACIQSSSNADVTIESNVESQIVSGKYTVKYAATVGGVTITATVEFTVKVETDPDSEEETEFNVTKVEYIAYDISG